MRTYPILLRLHSKMGMLPRLLATFALVGTFSVRAAQPEWAQCGGKDYVAQGGTTDCNTGLICTYINDCKCQVPNILISSLTKLTLVLNTGYSQVRCFNFPAFNDLNIFPVSKRTYNYGLIYIYIYDHILLYR